MELNTEIMIGIGIIILLVGLYFIFKKSSSEGGGGNGGNSCMCEHGCNTSDGSCITPNDICKPGYTGKNCNCEISKKPKQIDDPCKGLGSICNPDGSWTPPFQAKNCGDLFNMNGGTQDNWTKTCKSTLCPTNDDYNYKLECDDAGDPLWKCVKSCPKAPKDGDCADCNTPEKVLKKTCVCDDTTGGEWKCVPNENPGCPSNVPTGLCGPSGELPQCITCGSKGYLWHCSGGAPNPECLTDEYGLFSYPVKGGGNWVNDTRDNKPVYPTIDNDICVKGTPDSPVFPYTLLKQYDYNGYEVIGSADGAVTGYSAPLDPSKVNFIPRSKDLRYMVYNTHLDPSKDLDANGALKNPNTHNYKIISNEQAYEDGRGCMKENPDLSNFCNDQGEIFQYKFDINGNPVTTGDKVYYLGDQYGCNCKQYVSKFDGKTKKYLGPNCQYSDDKTCSQHGISSNSGICSCSPIWSGSDCSKPCPGSSGNVPCSGNGTCSEGTCTCQKGWSGLDCSKKCPIDSSGNICSGNGECKDGACICHGEWKGSDCQYSDATTCGEFGTVNVGGPNDGTCNYDCSKIYPRCAKCDYDTNQKPKDLSLIQCTSTVMPSEFGEIFDTSKCVQKDPNNPKIYGCPIKKDVAAWHDYVGSAWHNGDPASDVDHCVNPTSCPACRLQNSTNVDVSNYCYTPDFKSSPYLKDVDITGLADDRHAVGFAAGNSTVSYSLGTEIPPLPGKPFIFGMPDYPPKNYVQTFGNYWDSPCVPVAKPCIGK